MWTMMYIYLLATILCGLKILCSRRINDFYKIYFLSWPYPMVGLNMDRSIKKKYPTPEGRLLRLNRSTAALCKALPCGTYKAITHDRVIEALEHMQAAGRAVIIEKRSKGKPRKQKILIRHILGWRYPTKHLPMLQNYRVVFRIL